ncbi:unnamed protein product [Hymenolepis diminuta]|uniref:DUF5739 domain-containing protein n=1 Tax=Hymenolepis diminuta TaxID=6216 RepID=A0A0R3SVU5_HYMDI|nr:unnamed protein product [Hymenolepis diminuta]
MSHTHPNTSYFYIRVSAVVPPHHSPSLFTRLFFISCLHVVGCRRPLLLLESYSAVMIYTSPVLVYCLLVCCCLMLPTGRCHSLKLGQHTRAPLGLLISDVSPTSSSLPTPYWSPRVPPYAWPARRPPQWNQLEVQNCFSGPTPNDLLTLEEVLTHERTIQKAAESQQYLRRTQRILRLQHLQWLSHREFLASFGKTPKTRRKRHQRDLSLERSSTPPPSTPLPTAISRTESLENQTSEGIYHSSEIHNTTNSDFSITETSVTTEVPQDSALVTVHRLAIRSKTILISGGVMRARLRYLIQLHRAIEGRNKLSVEVRLHPQYPPIYTGTVEDVCTYWPADAPGSECSLRKRRFYQKGRICLCRMPPGLYHQRLKINFGDVFEGAQISQFLINIFSGQHLNLYVTVTLTSADNTTVACSQSKIPVSFSSL